MGHNSSYLKSPSVGVVSCATIENFNTTQVTESTQGQTTFLKKTILTGSRESLQGQGLLEFVIYGYTELELLQLGEALEAIAKSPSPFSYNTK
jgi:hypothetical protein